MANSDMLVRIKADTDSYNAGIAKARRTLEGFKQDNLTLGGIINQSTKSVVAAAAQYASFAAVLGTVASGMSEAISQGSAMAKEMEGVSMAFGRLNQPGLLDNLREATHGTVNDLELMKQAVKFDNFNLSLKEMGNMLAFAQQQAKDTGQDVGYLVDSIVTGLGRKSLPILDNLGLSATEIKDRMKETGDMTKAVADIIQERMKAAGGYVETASDRAAKATADLENAMTSLGETLVPLVGASDSLWNSIKIGATNALNTAVKPLIQALSEAGTLGQNARAMAGLGNLGGNSKVDRMIGRLGNGKTAGAYSIYQQQLGEFDKYINNKRFQIAAYGGDNSSIAQSAKQRLQTELDGALKMRAEYVKRAQELHSKVPPPFEPATTSGGKGGSGGGTTAPTYEADSIAAQSALVSELTKKFNESGEAVRNGMLPELVAAEAKLKSMKNEAAMLKEQAAGKLQGGWVMKTNLGSDSFAKDYLSVGAGLSSDKLPPITGGIEDMTKALKEQRMAFNLAGQAANSFSAALSGMEDPAAKAAGQVVSAIASIAMGFAMASSTAETAGTGWGWLAWLAAGASAMATTIATIHSLTGYAEGGIVKGNNSYSGDNVPIMANEGELVLTKAMQGNLASQMRDNGGFGDNFHAVLTGENIHIVHSRYLKRTGQGELVTWR